MANSGSDNLRVVAFFAVVFLFILFPVYAEADWLIDEAQFHRSAHGRLSCQECHDDISGKNVHPDPQNVIKKIKDFFDPTQCSACHDEALEEIQAGTHGGRAAHDQKLSTHCIDCHHPHDPLAGLKIRAQSDAAGSAVDGCGDCHEAKDQLPALSPEDEQCMRCHRSIAVTDNRISYLCFYCHGTKTGHPNLASLVQMPLIDVEAYELTAHRDLSCRVCHPQSAAFNHSNQPLGSCRRCHYPHDEKVAHDAHQRVDCEACHLRHIDPVRQPDNNRITWLKKDLKGKVSDIHGMVDASDQTTCRRCHHAGNRLGAAAMILPPKSIMCAPCHVATLSVGDTTTLVSMTLFFLGLIYMGAVWFSGTTRTDVYQLIRFSMHSIFSKRINTLLYVLTLDGLLLRRLFRMSKSRWLAHALIYYSMLFRCAWGIIALIASLFYPQWPYTWMMIDKHHPVNAFLFDLTGLLMIVGVIFMIVRKYTEKTSERPTGLPPKSWWGAGLLAFILIGGFLLEGMRISMTGPWEGASYAFVGYGLSAFFSSFDLTEVYGYMWYGHAIVTGLFLVCLPFNRMFHMLMAPLVLAIGAVGGHFAEEQKQR